MKPSFAVPHGIDHDLCDFMLPQEHWTVSSLV
jgi:hypothetical protein